MSSSQRQYLLRQYFNTLFKVFVFAFVWLGVNSCNVVKRVQKEEYLIVDNTILEDGKKIKQERVNNIIIQKENAGMNGLLGLSLPLKLHIYNLARPNIDSIIDANILSDSLKVKRRTALLSKKQFDKYISTKKGFNSWLKRTGEAPVIFDEKKTEVTANNLRKYYYSIGWLDNTVDYEVEKDSNKKAKVIYKITKNKPYSIDSIKSLISTPAIDSLYPKIEKNSFLKKGEQYNEDNFEKERLRINTFLRNSGYFHFGQDYIRFEIDTIGTQQKINSEIIISNRIIRGDDSTIVRPFKPFKIKEVNIFTDNTFDNRFKTVSDTTVYDGYNLYSKEGLKFRPNALTDAVFINNGDLYTDLARRRTSRYLNDLQMFGSRSIEYVENPEDSTLITNIYLAPRKKYSLNFDFDVSQSNIQTVGFSFGTGLKIRNIFRGAETLDITGFTSIGASKDRKNIDDPFFDINELGANIRLTFPRIWSPINTDNIIPKYMSPSTSLTLSTSSQTNIGLDKQTLQSILAYNWQPSETVTNELGLFDILFVKNLNTDNYFGVYSTSYDRLNSIAQDIGYIGNDENLGIPDEADLFISEVLNEQTSLTPEDEDFTAVSNIDERKQRLTENNLIISSTFSYRKNTRKNLFDNNFSIFKWRIETAGNVLAGLSRLTGAEKNDNGNYEVLGVSFSQYIKTELDYVKYISLGKRNIFAFRGYAGIAIPFGNSNSIPFVESFFGGGPNDNRAWTPYDLGPGSTDTNEEFNEANFKLHFSAEQRFNLFGNLRGAVFVDAGNIWNVFDNVEEEAATFSSLESLRDIAVGSGFGLRYDFDFFVLRFDVGFKTYDPAYQLGDRWFKDYNFKNAVYNIGINYPF
ncbi:BamA/TamA family outer membrane protein [Winogradskyella sp. DF17]|uniref:BamA/TamA family outer membrane protein n=1 Tax=Winogradskyella pelagia TaxID=2819984 RepID=A0ABS3T040_9FLAO|nr:BamA/TamA family outer membrane protein [Winogradskyella sp. DF17]MBO3115804.1 BamA/TamA family outer membrane protein [Winogradskyella sp. DF17]